MNIVFSSVNCLAPAELISVCICYSCIDGGTQSSYRTVIVQLDNYDMHGFLHVTI